MAFPTTEGSTSDDKEMRIKDLCSDSVTEAQIQPSKSIKKKGQTQFNIYGIDSSGNSQKSVKEQTTSTVRKELPQIDDHEIMARNAGQYLSRQTSLPPSN